MAQEEELNHPGDELASVPAPEPRPAAPPAQPEPVDQQELVRRTVQKLINYIGVRGRVEVTYEGEGYVADIRTKRPSGVLIGKHGDTLKAIGYIAHLIVQKQYPQVPLVLVDVGGYRHRHEQYLRGKARAIATLVAGSGREMAVEFLTEPEYMIVKDELASSPEFRVHAVGDGQRRNVIISPVRK
jgi:spoIIIJ-associated protein